MSIILPNTLYYSCRPSVFVCSLRWLPPPLRVAPWPWPSVYDRGHGNKSVGGLSTGQLERRLVVMREGERPQEPPLTDVRGFLLVYNWGCGCQSWYYIILYWKGLLADYRGKFGVATISLLAPCLHWTWFSPKFGFRWPTQNIVLVLNLDSRK